MIFCYEMLQTVVIVSCHRGDVKRWRMGGKIIASYFRGCFLVQFAFRTDENVLYPCPMHVFFFTYFHTLCVLLHCMFCSHRQDLTSDKECLKSFLVFNSLLQLFCSEVDILFDCHKTNGHRNFYQFINYSLPLKKVTGFFFVGSSLTAFML